MSFLPIVERELRVGARRWQTYWLRFSAAALVLGVCMWVWWVSGMHLPSYVRGKNLFYAISALTFFYALVAGTNATSDCVSEEKREGTLGLLFLTDLKGYDVVLGKLAATSIASAYAMLAVLPMLGIPFLLGGLSGGEFWRMAVVLVNTLFFSLSAGMLASVVSVGERAARGMAFLLIVSMAGLAPLLGLFLGWYLAPMAVSKVFFMASPVYSYWASADPGLGGRLGGFWVSIGITHLAGWICLIGSSIWLPRSWQDKPASGRWAGWSERMRGWRFGGEEERRIFRRRLLDENAYFWLAGRDRLRPMYVLGTLGLIGAIWLWFFLKWRADMLEPVMHVFMGLILGGVLKFWMASEACRSLAEDRRSGALELLISTPLSVDEILRGQLLALRRQFGLATGIVIVLAVLMYLSGARQANVGGTGEWFLLFAGGIGLLVADLYALSWVGMWLGLTARKANAATGAAFRILVLPWVIFVGLLTLLAFSSAGGGMNRSENLIGVWVLIGVFNNIVFCGWARTRLRRDFREIAAGRFQQRKPGDQGSGGGEGSVEPASRV